METLLGREESLLKATANFSLIATCSAAGADAGCLGVWTDSERGTARRMLAFVDADTVLRRQRMDLLDAAQAGAPLIVVLPHPSGRRDASRVRFELVLQARFGGSGARCSYSGRVVVELNGDDLDEAIARELPGEPRSLQSLHPTLEWAAPEDTGRTER